MTDYAFAGYPTKVLVGSLSKRLSSRLLDRNRSDSPDYPLVGGHPPTDRHDHLVQGCGGNANPQGFPFPPDQRWNAAREAGERLAQSVLVGLNQQSRWLHRWPCAIIRNRPPTALPVPATSLAYVPPTKQRYRLVPPEQHWRHVAARSFLDWSVAAGRSHQRGQSRRTRSTELSCWQLGKRLCSAQANHSAGR